MAFTTLANAKAALGNVTTTAADDAFITAAIASVGDALEAMTGRFLWPRSSATYLFDASDSPWTLDMPIGVQSVTLLGIAWTDQPDDGTGTYTTVPAARYYLDPPAQLRPPGYPATAITLAATAGIAFPTSGRRVIKVTGTWGPSATPTRVEQIGTNAVIRAFRAKTSGGADYTLIGADGGQRIMRDFAPSEVDELYAMFSVGGGVLG